MVPSSVQESGTKRPALSFCYPCSCHVPRGTLRHAHGRWRPGRERLGAWRPSGRPRGRAVVWCRAPVRSCGPGYLEAPARVASGPSWDGAHATSTLDSRYPSRPPRGRRVRDVVVTPGAGWAVPHKPVLACRVPPAPRGQPADGRRAVQACGTRRRNGWAVADGWREAGVPPVARASPGDYGPPVDPLRAGIGTVLWGTVAPGQPVPGRQMDWAEAR